MALNDSPTPTRGVPVQLDRERHLRFTLRTIREIRTEFGMDALTEGVSMEAIAKLLWYGLKHEDPDLTVEAVEELVDMQNLTELIQAVTAATGGRMPTVVEEPPAQDPPAEPTAAADSPAAGALQMVTG